MEDHPPEKPKKRRIPSLDTRDLTRMVDPRYSISHPQLIEGDEPKSSEEAEKRNFEDAVLDSKLPAIEGRINNN